ncbi:hypothetical protein VE03_06495 [Pseudogymnoascus sp. 23342-1-I1]|nr:hypothetical protein VE03_06495 [Pseudogymnoascus sp. 23342-1-I1]
MVYIMRIFVDGACRNNGYWGAEGSAAAVFKRGKNRILQSHKYCLPDDPTPTNQRAELTAIIVALKQAIRKHRDLDTCPRLDVKICSDSDYAVRCMNEFVFKWLKNGWITAAGHPVKNQDLIKEAVRFLNELKELGKVRIRWIPRGENQEADQLCNDVLDGNGYDDDYDDDYYYY